jgi:hypothetical protein
VRRPAGLLSHQLSEFVGLVVHHGTEDGVRLARSRSCSRP